MSEKPMTAAEPESELLYDVRDGVAWVSFNRPQTRNALTFPMYTRLEEICEAADSDRSIKAMVIAGAGDKAFAAGTDISQFVNFESADDALVYERRIDRVLSALEKCRVPTIAAISGACTGGGAAIAACCDLRLGTQTAQIGFPIARTLGNCLSMNSIARLVALIGPARVKDIIFTARLLGAEEARSIGLLQEVVADHAALLQRAGQLASIISGHAPLTLQATKEALRRLQSTSVEHDDQDLILMCYMSQDFREGIDAFLRKRQPRWLGR
ncbi:MAG TPA: enoyl-CoA hydratase/isomerase family protein [Azospirillum sp.]|nr:enoyl-CoA hydratase/isomerase family protein [Azospirillum sp.]